MFYRTKHRKMKNFTVHFTVFLILLLSTSCQEQTKKNKSKSSIETKSIATNDRPKRITRIIKQDSNGTIWFASWDGIITYDGTTFTNITKTISSSRFFSVLEDKKGNFWFASIGSGVYYYDGKNIQNFTTKDGLANNRVTVIYEDRKGRVWFGTEGGASCYDGGSFQNFTTKEGLPNNSVNAIIEDQSGKFWFGTSGDAAFFDGSKFSKIRNNNGSSFKNVRHFIEDKKAGIWLGGNEGLWRYQNNTFTNYSDEFVGYIYEDKTGTIWTTSESSNNHEWVLSRYEAATLYSKKPIVTEIRKEEGMFFGILVDTDGSVWLGTLNGVYCLENVVNDDFKNKSVRH